MADRPKQRLRLSAIVPLKQMPISNEHRTPGEADTFAQMLVDAKHG